MLAAPAADGCRDLEPHAAVRGELERVGQQVLQHLQQALGVGDDAPRQARIDVDVEVELAPLGFQAERAARRVVTTSVNSSSSASTVTVPDSIFDRSRMSVMRLSRSVPGAVDGARELDLLRRQVALRVVAQLLAEDQDAVERRAQLVRHVGQELGLVLRRQRELGGLLLQRAPRLLDLAVLALDLGVLLGELLRLLAQLLVGLLQLGLLRLQLARRAAATA